MTLFAFLSIVWPGIAQAAGRQPFTVATPDGPVLVESFADEAAGPRPAVLILSGSRGFGASAYDEIGQTFAARGLDAYLVHVMSAADLDAIANAPNAHARIAYYTKRLPGWTAAVHATVSYLKIRPRHAGKIGILGISLGAQIAAASSADSTIIDALVLVDGGFPNGYSRTVHTLPPLLLIWGSADRTFPLSLGQALYWKAKALGTPASLQVYDGGAHDFFLRSGTWRAAAAHNSAAGFLALQLSQ